MRLVLVWTAALTVGVGCKSNTETPPPVDTNEGVKTARAQLLKAAGTCVSGRSQEFVTAAKALETATAAWKSAPSDTTLQAARDSYRQAMAAWQVMEVMRLGPAAPKATAGGQDLRDRIYSWPLISTCAVEEVLVNGTYEAGLSQALVNRRGLGALEHLLFSEMVTTTCTASSPTAAGWAALSPEARATRRQAYAAAAAADVRVRAEELAQAWSPTGGNFAHTLESAGESNNATYPTTQVALNALSDAMFDLEREGKDAKLAIPLGLRNCEATHCPEQVESRISKLSKQNLVANTDGFRRLMQGCEASYAGPGFDDLLVAVGQESLAQKMIAALDGINAALAAVEEQDLEAALTADPNSVRAVYDAFKALNDLLKTQFVTVLDLELPRSLEGDND